MAIVYLSYAQINEYNDPHKWLKKLAFYVGILEALTKYGSVKSVHCISYEGVLRKNNVEYHFLKRRQWQHWFPFELHSYLKNLRPDTIIIHGLIFPWQVIMLRWQIGRNVKIIVQHHAEKPFQDIRRYLQRWADRYIGAYLFCSMEQGMQWVEQTQIRNKKKIREIMGTSSPFHVIGKDLAKSFTKVKDGANFLWVGGLDDNKDPLLVARAFVRFTRENPSANLYMIYQTFQLLEELKTVLKDAPDAAANIHLIGRVEHDQLLYWYNSVDFIISSSHYEGSGIAVCEALSCGCIPILTDIPSFRMMSDNGKVSLLYKSGNEEALLNCLYQSLELDRDELKRLILQHFNKRLSFDANAEGITKVIQSLEIDGKDFKAESSA